MAHNENTRVKIPAILHLNRLGYEYLSLKKATWDESKRFGGGGFGCNVKALLSGVALAAV